MSVDNTSVNIGKKDSIVNFRLRSNTNCRAVAVVCLSANGCPSQYAKIDCKVTGSMFGLPFDSVGMKVGLDDGLEVPRHLAMLKQILLANEYLLHTKFADSTERELRSKSRMTKSC